MLPGLIQTFQVRMAGCYMDGCYMDGCMGGCYMGGCNMDAGLDGWSDEGI